MNKTDAEVITRMPVKCFHCGNETLMKTVGEFRWNEDDEFYSKHIYRLLVCPVCYKITLLYSYSNDILRYNYRSDGYTEDKILYPSSSFDSEAMPLIIKEAFEAALKVRNIDKYVCLMSLRRTLELILKDKGATKWGLKDKIEEIASRGLLPDVLKEASALTKMLGDTAAHDKDITVGAYDVESMAEFVEYIIDYLYVLPYKIERYKKKLNAKEDTTHV